MTDIEAAELLEQMAGVYPGDITGDLVREACKLRGIPYDPPIITFEYIDEPQPK